MRAVSLAALLLGATSSLAEAQYLVNELSFGYNSNISPGDNGIIPNFHLHGNPGLPEILSNKIVLTPVAPGNQRGAVWADRPLSHSTWETDVDFRASGPERGGGNLNFWVVRDGAAAVGASSIYTVGRFDGLAIVIDAHAGSGGMIRAFLNDGSMDYAQQHNFHDRAFGHCIYSYRNLGRPSHLKIKQTPDVFRVEIDGRMCFETDKVRIPSGYHLGLTAATPDNPDSFEIFKLVVMTNQLHPDHSYTEHPSTGEHRQQPADPQHQQHLGEDHSAAHDYHSDHATEQQPKPGQPEHVVYGRGGYRTSDFKPDPVPEDPFDSAIPDAAADTFTSSRSQFEDLHNRLQSVNHHLSTIFRTTAKLATQDEHRHAETSEQIDRVRREIMTRLDALTGLVELSHKVDTLEKQLANMRADMTGQLRNSEHSIKGFIGDTHATLSDNLVSASPGHGRLIFVIVASQLVLAGAYVLYKRRQNASPKKYL